MDRGDVKEYKLATRRCTSSGMLMHSIVIIVNCTILYTSLLRDSILNVLITYTHTHTHTEMIIMWHDKGVSLNDGVNHIAIYK